MNRFCKFLFFAICTQMAGCASQGPAQGQNEAFEVAAEVDAPSGNQVPQEPKERATPVTAFIDTPSTPSVSSGATGERSRKVSLSSPQAQVEVNFYNLRIEEFINEVFANILGLSFELSSDLTNRDDLVTLRASGKQTHQRLFEMSEDVLLNYGVGLELLENHIRFFPAIDPERQSPPLLITGAALPEVPPSSRPIFQIVPVKYLSASAISALVKSSFKGTKLVLGVDDLNNSLILEGPARIVTEAVRTVSLLDRPSMRGHFSVHIKPAFVQAEALSKMLADVLSSEGISVSTQPPFGATIILPMAPTNSVIVFSPDEQILEHIKAWATQLDQPASQSAGGDFFYYQVRNTSASDLADILSQIGQSSPSEGGASGSVSGILVDENRNGLILTDKTDWKSLLPVIQAMDRAPRLVNVEVTVASVSISNDSELGLEWLFNSNHGRFQGVGRSSFGLGGSGFSYTLSNSGEVRLAINALVQDQRVSILSKPSVLVKSGKTAKIDVGEEVPIVTSQAQGIESPNAPVLQSISYRKTGVLLEVSPTVHSQDQVDLRVAQEVSEVVNATSGGVDSPSIFNRSVDTTLTLKDGGAVIIGGLVSTSKNKGQNKIPGLGNIPGLGTLFKTSGNQEIRSELVLVIQAQVIDIEEKDWSFNEELQRKLKELDAF